MKQTHNWISSEKKAPLPFKTTVPLCYCLAEHAYGTSKTRNLELVYIGHVVSSSVF